MQLLCLPTRKQGFVHRVTQNWWEAISDKGRVWAVGMALGLFEGGLGGSLSRTWGHRAETVSRCVGTRPSRSRGPVTRRSEQEVGFQGKGYPHVHGAVPLCAHREPCPQQQRRGAPGSTPASPDRVLTRRRLL